MPLVDLLRRSASGDATALRELFMSVYPSVRGIVHRHIEQQVGQEAIGLLALFSTGDVVQEAFLAVVSGVPPFSGCDDSALVRWLSARVHDRVIDSMRQQLGLRESAAASGAGTAGREPRGASALRRPGSAQARILAGLADRERDLLHARLVAESSWEAIAAVFGFASPDTARFVFQRVQARLLVELARAGL